MSEDLISLSAGWLSFANTDMDGLIKGEFHKDNEEIARLMQFLVRQRTPVITGAAQASVQYEVNTDTSSDDLVILFANDAEQIEAWNRVYFPYIEGGELGLATWTNPPRLAFASLETDDLPLIQAWAESTLNKSLDHIAAGVGTI